MKYKVMFTVAVFILLTLVTSDASAQKKIDIPANELNVSIMSKLDAYKTKWTYECANNKNPTSNYKSGFLCGVEFVRIVEKYDIKYKTILGIKNEKIATKLIKRYLINSFLSNQYFIALKVFDYRLNRCTDKYEIDSLKYKDCIRRKEPRKMMEDVYQTAKEYLGPLDLYASWELKIYKPGFVVIFGDY